VHSSLGYGFFYLFFREVPTMRLIIEIVDFSLVLKFEESDYRIGWLIEMTSRIQSKKS
jgi:hypothetical protein